ncbi:filamentous hemagglutinin N-terminal domain-containing protein [Desulfococcaceae bacterium HSG8]|nr:filamentous hemagglutinin N-terminal domain-containing protein [Desulfococcaceae bacterium HSG8]
MKHLIMALLMTIAAAQVYADGTHPNGIRLDGTIGNAGKLDLPGPDYKISDEYGRQAGTNLFHSFQQFNIHSGESATFTGPDSVQNIISRVTGGDPSWIDGKLRSEIPGADMYLLNPAGMMFGPGASLDLGGSFHVSTADYLGLENGERFYTMPQENEVMSVAAPTAFGFLDNEVGSISFEGRGEITEQEWKDNPSGLHVSEGETISLIGGDIELTKGSRYETQEIDENGEPVFEKVLDEEGLISEDENGDPILATDENGNPIPAMETVYPADISAPGGRINLVGVASAGEVTLTQEGPDISSDHFGDITISDRIVSDVSGDGDGSIFARGEHFVSDASDIHAGTTGDKAGKILIDARNISFINGSSIHTTNYGKGQGGNVTLRASESAIFIGGVDDQEIRLSTDYDGEYAASSGSLLIEAEHISISEDFQCISEANGTGITGDMTFRATESVFLNDATFNSSMGKSATGEGGIFSIEAGDIFFEEEVSVRSSTFGKANSGDVIIKASGSFDMSESTIQLTVARYAEGYGGNLSIEAENISLNSATHRILINSGTYGVGNGGNITLRASESVNLSDSAVLAGTAGKYDEIADGGTILIEAPNISLNNGAEIGAKSSRKGEGGEVTIRSSSVTLSGTSYEGEASKIYTSALGRKEGAGSAGNILIETDTLSLRDGGMIKASTEGFGSGASMTVRASGHTEISGVNPHGENEDGFSSGIYADSSAEAEDSGKSGDIAITAGTLSVTDGAMITNSTSGGGQGGKITINAEGVRISGDSSDIELKEPSETQLDFQEEYPDHPEKEYISGIYSRSESQESFGGEAGVINITAEDLGLSDRGTISTSTSGGGKAGNITLKIDDLRLNNDSLIASMSTSSDSGGPAGTITINTGNSVYLRNNSLLTTEAINSSATDETDDALNGKVMIIAGNSLRLSDSGITTSVRSGTGNGGDIEIAPEFVILDNSKLTANAYEGDGGNIRIAADQFIRSAGSVADASSHLGIDGSVIIESPETDISSGLGVLPGNFIEAGEWVLTPCAERFPEKRSHFLITGTYAAPTSSDDLWASPPISPDASSDKPVKKTLSLEPYLELSEIFRDY